MSKERLFKTIDTIGHIEANVSFLFFADKAIYQLIADGNYNISDINLLGMDNIKELVLGQLSSLSDEVSQIRDDLEWQVK